MATSIVEEIVKNVLKGISITTLPNQDTKQVQLQVPIADDTVLKFNIMLHEKKDHIVVDVCTNDCFQFSGYKSFQNNQVMCPVYRHQ